MAKKRPAGEFVSVPPYSPPISVTSCHNCHFFRSHYTDPYGRSDTQITGYCCFDPPTSVNGFPYTSSTNWCGKFQLKMAADLDTTAKALAEAVLAGDMTAARALADRIKEC